MNNCNVKYLIWVFKLLNEIIKVLSELKYKGLFHMDIKPCNILMSERFSINRDT